MRDSFVGDIGDFANNGLLRYLCGMTGPQPDNPLRLGVVWYLNKSDGSEGNAIGYLNKSDYNDSLYRECDPPLYDSLQRLVGASLLCRTERNIGQISDSLILPRNTQYFDVRVPVGKRKDWRKGALEKTAKADLLFLNPDTGLAPKSVKSPHHRDGPKYAFIDDLTLFYKKGKSLIIYQDLSQGIPPGKNVGTRIKAISKCLKDKLKLDNEEPPYVWVLRWNRAPTRTYFIVAQSVHKSLLCGCIKDFLVSPWGKKKPSKGAKKHFTKEYP